MRFIPDKTIFPGFSFNLDFVRKSLWRNACLNSGLKLYLNGELIHSTKGLLDLLDKETEVAKIYESIHCKGKTLEFAFSHTDGHGKAYFSFVNGTYWKEVNLAFRFAFSRHISAFCDGILKGIKEYSGKKFIDADLRNGLQLALSIKIRDTMPIVMSRIRVV